MNWLYVGLGGAIGATLRFAAQGLCERLVPGFPAGTAAVNAVGSLVIGMILPALPALPEATRPFVVVGVLGGLTTMSSFSGEVVTLIDQGRVGAAMLHWVGGAVVCVALCALGYVASTRLMGAQIR